MDVSADASDEDIIMEDWDISASPQDLHPWPPRPTCEEERVSLANEVGGQILIETLQNDDAVSRGTIDQTPILIGIYSQLYPSAQINQDPETTSSELFEKCE